MNLIQINQLVVGFPSVQGDVVKKITFQISVGERVAIVGESGSGKSVTARALMRLDRHAYYSGAIHFHESDILAMPEPQLRQLRGRRIAMIFQEPMSALNPLYTIGEQIVEVLCLHRALSRSQAKLETIALLQRVGIEDAERKQGAYPFQLSGGQRQRAMIAMALAGDPELLIADEPTTALDVSLQAQIMALLLDLQRERNMALLLITHDLTLVQDFAQRVIVMQSGHIVEEAETAQLFRAPAHPYTQTLLSARQTRLVTPKLSDADTVLSVRALQQDYTLRKFLHNESFSALAAIDFDLCAGETLAVVGESGSGKTSLAMALLRLVKGGQGEITCQKMRFDLLKGAVLRQARRHMQMVFQDPFAAFSQRQVIADIVAEGLLVHEPALSKEQRRQCVFDILIQVGIDPSVMDRYPHELSGGQRQRIAIARALILKPRILVLDEPTSALDASVQQQVLALLVQLQQTHGLAYVLITHDLSVVRMMAHRMLVLQNGRLVETGEVEQILQAPQHHYTQSLLKASLL